MICLMILFVLFSMVVNFLLWCWFRFLWNLCCLCWKLVLSCVRLCCFCVWLVVDSDVLFLFSELDIDFRCVVKFCRFLLCFVNLVLSFVCVVFVGVDLCRIWFELIVVMWVMFCVCIVVVFRVSVMVSVYIICFENLLVSKIIFLLLLLCVCLECCFDLELEFLVLVVFVFL